METNKRTAAESVMNVFEQAFEGVPHTVSERYGYKSIMVEGGEENDTYIWVRLKWLCDQDRFIVEISNITLDEKYRRRGIFTSIVSKLLENKYVKEVKVCEVLTDEMHSACRKLNMTYEMPLNCYTASRLEE